MRVNLEHYLGVRKQLLRYWKTYGGWSALIASPYLHAALLITVLCVGFWSKQDWTGQAQSVLPNLLGFTLGGFAVFLSFGSDNFRSLIAGADGGVSKGKTSPYLNMSASFLHFVLVQGIALIWCIVGSAMFTFNHGQSGWIGASIDALIFIGNGLGYLLFIYAIFAGIAAALAIFRAARWYDEFATGERADKRIDGGDGTGQ
jgi:hypothetical protein